MRELAHGAEASAVQKVVADVPSSSAEASSGSSSSYGRSAIVRELAVVTEAASTQEVVADVRPACPSAPV